MRMRIQDSNYLSPSQLKNQYINQNPAGVKAPGETEVSFQDILRTRTAQESFQRVQEAGSLKFSKHAASRLADRQITLSDSQMERLSDGTRKAGEKGIQESLVLMDQLAFIVNIPNKTVITAMDQAETNENIFTNIDGAVII